MSTPHDPATPPPKRHWLTIRLSAKEKQWVAEQASIAGLSQSGYLRRQVFHGRPILALTDEIVLRELRRLGGLLKGNFVTLRQAGCDPMIQRSMEQTLEPFLVCFAKANNTRLRFAGKARFSRLLTARNVLLQIEMVSCTGRRRAFVNVGRYEGCGKAHVFS